MLFETILLLSGVFGIVLASSISFARMLSYSLGLIIVSGTRSVYVDGYTVDHFLGKWSPLIMDRPGKVFLIDGHVARRLHKLEISTLLSTQELNAVQGWIHSNTRVCVVRNNELVDKAAR